MTRPQTPQTTHRIALLFNANKVYDREIITGIGNYLLSTRVAWDLFLEEDFRCRLTGIERFDGDGIIADFDDPAVGEALRDCPLPVVAVGSSFEDPAHYPPDLPYIATDNSQARLARLHASDRRGTRTLRFVQPAAGAGEPLGAAARTRVRSSAPRRRPQRRADRRRDLSRPVDQRAIVESGNRATHRLAAANCRSRSASSPSPMHARGICCRPV